jgi:hypothetical protein
MNVEIGAEAAVFPEKEYISGIFVAVQMASRFITPVDPCLGVNFAQPDIFLLQLASVQMCNDDSYVTLLLCYLLQATGSLSDFCF